MPLCVLLCNHVMHTCTYCFTLNLVFHCPVHQRGNPLLDEQSLQLRQSVVYAVILQMWRSLAFNSDNFSSIPNNISIPDTVGADMKAEVIASSLALAIKVWNQQQHQQLQLALHRQQQHAGRNPSPEATSFNHTRDGLENSIGYVSISPSPSELAMPNALFEQQEETQVDINAMVRQVDFDSHLLLREALLPLFSAAGIKVPSQIKVTCHNSSELNVEYNFSLNKGEVIVTDNSTSGSTLRSLSQPPKSDSMLFLQQVCASGSLKYLVKSKSSQLQNTSYIVTTNPPTDTSNVRQQRSNITSKFSVRLDTVEVDITFPLMMLCRHSSLSFRYWVTQRRLARSQASKVDKQAVAVNGMSGQGTAMEGIEETDQPEVGTAWAMSRSLVEWFLSMERERNPPPFISELSRGSEPSRVTASSTPQEKHRVIDYISKHSHDHTLSVKDTQAQLSSGQSLNSLTSGDHQNLPGEVSIKIEPSSVPSRFYSPLHGGADAGDDTTDSPQIFSSDNDTPVQSSLATYNVPSRLNGSHGKGLKLETATQLHPHLETPNLREGLSVVEEKLQFSVFGLVKISTIKVKSQLETLVTVFEVQGVTGAVDCRKMKQDKSNGVQKTAGKPSKTLLVYKGKSILI